MLESQVNSAIVDHVFKKNELVSDRQLTYRKGLSTETMLIQFTEKWRNLIDSNMKIAVAFIDFKKLLTVFLIQFWKGNWNVILVSVAPCYPGSAVTYGVDANILR